MEAIVNSAPTLKIVFDKFATTDLVEKSAREL